MKKEIKNDIVKKLKTTVKKDKIKQTIFAKKIEK